MSHSIIEIDECGVRRELGNGKVEQVAWNDLVEVSVMTTSDGPFAEDVFFVLVGRNGAGCITPHGAPECSHLMEWLGRLPGFDYEPEIRAMSYTHDARFVCWRHPTNPGESMRVHDHQ